jgi:hypothetical protein
MLARARVEDRATNVNEAEVVDDIRSRHSSADAKVSSSAGEVRAYGSKRVIAFWAPVSGI